GLGLAFSFDPNRHFQAFLAFTVFWEFLFEDSDKTNERAGLEIEQAYFFLKDIWEDRFSFQAGRQRFEDEREWLFDEELDGVRTFYKKSNFTTEFSISRLNLLERDLLNSDEEDRINNYLFRTIYQVDNGDKEHYSAAYLFFQDDRSEENESPFFIGIQSNGDLFENTAYWLELALVLGKEGSDDIRAFGFDIGFTYELDLPLEPSVTFGFAFGTGDDNPEDGESNSFRQTGFQNNEGSFNGVPDFSYYGEVFDPELSNLLIFTAGLGINITEKSSIDFVYHYYQQHKSFDSFRDVGIDAEPNGESKNIGNEVDLILGYEEIWNTELALRLGYFIPGNAFSSESANVFSALLEFQYEFR
ncbi:MAG: alginate export family protein, partial [Thermodesulfobacteriota bacterium]